MTATVDRARTHCFDRMAATQETHASHPGGDQALYSGVASRRGQARDIASTRQPPPVSERRALASQAMAEGATQRIDDAEGPGIEVFDGPAARKAAAMMGAHGFSWRGRIFLGERLGLDGAPSRDEVIRHERTHVRQMRNKGSVASESRLEAEAHETTSDTVELAADPETPYGFWWVVPIAVGLYTLLRPNVANAPGPGDPVQPSVSPFQVAGEALTLFALPGGMVRTLGRAGYGAIASFGLTGATTSIAYRGLQDLGAGEPSSVEAYVFDAVTGMFLGVVMGGSFRLLGGRLQPGNLSNPPLTHFTSTAGQSAIQSSGVLRGGQGIWALPSGAESNPVIIRVLRSLVRPSSMQRPIPIPGSANALFSPPQAMGPVSLYQRLMGVHRAPAGAIDLARGTFAPAGRLANIQGQFFPYGADMLFWSAAGATSAAMLHLGDSEEGGLERGAFGPIYDLIQPHFSQPVTVRNDGPFILMDPSQMFDGDHTDPTSGAAGQQGPASAPSRSLAPASGALGPAIIFVTPLQYMPLQRSDATGARTTSGGQ
ncbi:MAG: DUF4157 domain-containing protein [Phycisphaerales bacterium]|nr:DUF4157 domain-containing protein [Phycisphaerales bacterium]